MNSQYVPDPPREWERKCYDEALLQRLDYNKKEDRRSGSEIETGRDLAKPLEQLVCDVHEETHDPARSELANLAGAQKRMVSMMARVAKANDEASRHIICLTYAIGIMTLVVLLLTYLMWRSPSAEALQKLVELHEEEIRLLSAIKAK